MYVYVCVGAARQQYAKALIKLDEFVKSIVDMLADKGILDNTYIIFR